MHLQYVLVTSYDALLTEKNSQYDPLTDNYKYHTIY